MSPRSIALLLPLVLFVAACSAGSHQPGQGALQDANHDGIYDSTQPTPTATTEAPPQQYPTLAPRPAEPDRPPSDNHSDMPEIRSRDPVPGPAAST